MSERLFIHPLAWLIWLLAAVAVLTVTRNPIYLGLTLLWVGLTYAIVKRFWRGSAGAPIFSPLAFALFVILVSTIFNGLTVHVGRLTLFTLPPSIPLLGGKVTGEALLYGALNGAALAGLFVAFAVVSRVVGVRALIRLAPRAYYAAAVVASIAVTYVPATRRHFEQVREAQAIRGHAMTSARSWLPLALPLLIGGLERALQLAEAMMARGFAGTPEEETPLYPRLLALAGLAAILAGWLLRLVWQQALPGGALMLAGGVMLAIALRETGRRHPHTVYRPDAWTPTGLLVGLAALLTLLLFFLPVPGLSRESIYYYPYYQSLWPDFNLWLGLATWGLLAPAAALIFDVMRNEE
ncbi:MAG: hypothetical protein H6642_17665 [Caldilineaceae bacterium]|nr:hypothetical protein [Caldilineaceae bacterium]